MPEYDTKSGKFKVQYKFPSQNEYRFEFEFDTYEAALSYIEERKHYSGGAVRWRIVQDVSVEKAPAPLTDAEIVAHLNERYFGPPGGGNRIPIYHDEVRALLETRRLQDHTQF